LDAAKTPDCKVLSTEIDFLINSISSFFHKSSKRKHALTTLQEQLFDSKKTIKCYHKIRWLSRWQAISSFCDSLEFVLIFSHDESDDVVKCVLEKLGQFKYIYILYFLADILHSLVMLSKVFQLKFVDVTTVGSIVRTEVAQICMMFIVDSCDLNADVFNDSIGYHVLPNYGPHGGYLKRLQSEVRGSMFHSFQMTRSRLGTDLKDVLMF
jgi:hypothetical protein